MNVIYGAANNRINIRCLGLLIKDGFISANLASAFWVSPGVMGVTMCSQFSDIAVPFPNCVDPSRRVDSLSVNVKSRAN